MRKLFISLILSVSTIILTTSYSVVAHDQIYACIKNDASLEYRDTHCKNSLSASKPRKQNLVSKVEVNLRPLELLMLQRLHERRLQEYKIKQDINFTYLPIMF